MLGPALFIAALSVALAAPQDFDQGNRLLAEGDSSGAEAAFRRALADDPENADIRAQLALMLTERGMHEAAVKELESIIDAYPGHPASTWYLGLTRHRLGEFREAVVAFRAFASGIEETSPQWTSVHWYLADSYYRLMGTVGLNQAEVDQLLASCAVYIDSNSETNEGKRLEQIVAYVKKNRPPRSVKHWMVASDEVQAARASQGSTGSITMSTEAAKTPNPVAPKGYTWVACDGATTCHFLLPDGWFVKKQTQGDAHALFLTKEEIAPPDMRFETGLSVNRNTGIRRKSGQSASAYALAFLAEIRDKEGPTLVQMPGTDRQVYAARGAIQRGADHDPIQKNYLLVAVDDEDLLYIAIFEAPASTWDAAWAVGAPMLSSEYFAVADVQR